MVSPAFDSLDIPTKIRLIEEASRETPEKWLHLLVRVLGIAQHHPWVTSTHEERIRVLTYVATHSDKEVDWKTLAHEVQVSEGHLGPLMVQLIEREFVVQPDYRRFIYRLPDVLSQQIVLLMRWEAGYRAMQKQVIPADDPKG